VEEGQRKEEEKGRGENVMVGGTRGCPQLGSTDLPVDEGREEEKGKEGSLG